MNILELGQRAGRVLLEQACRGLIDEDPHRQISYTAVKHRITALRASLDARPTVADDTGVVVTSPVVGAPGRGTPAGPTSPRVNRPGGSGSDRHPGLYSSCHRHPLSHGR